MNCRQALRAVHARSENQISKYTEEALNAHLQVCARCRKESEQIEALTTHLQDFGIRLEAPLDLADQIWMAVQESKIQQLEKAPPRRIWMNWRYATLGTAAALIALVTGSFFAPVSHQIASNPGLNHGHSRIQSARDPEKTRKFTATLPSQNDMDRKALSTEPAGEKPVITMRHLSDESPVSSITKRHAHRHRLASTRLEKKQESKALSRKLTTVQPSASDYEQVAKSLREAHEAELVAKEQVQAELERTAKVLSEALELIQENKTKTVPMGTDG
jgi:hypothetical protein